MVRLAIAAMLASSSAAAEPAHRSGVGASVADPLGVTARTWIEERVAIQAVAGWRVLGNETIDFPGPLVAVDWIYRWPIVGGLSVHAGYGGGAGWIDAGCHFDAIAEVCVETRAPSFLMRAPLGVDLVLGKLEVGFEAVPAVRVTPDTNRTFLGGFAVRWYP